MKSNQVLSLEIQNVLPNYGAYEIVSQSNYSMLHKNIIELSLSLKEELMNHEIAFKKKHGVLDVFTKIDFLSINFCLDFNGNLRFQSFDLAPVLEDSKLCDILSEQLFMKVIKAYELKKIESVTLFGDDPLIQKLKKKFEDMTISCFTITK